MKFTTLFLSIALIAAIGCGDNIAAKKPTGAAGATMTGSAGTTGEAGTTGTAGTGSVDPTGAAGTGFAGDTGSAGTDGGAGTGAVDPTGAAGTGATDPTGSAGTDGSNSTGTAGTEGTGTAGAGVDPTGTAGAGGTDSTGTAGTTGTTGSGSQGDAGTTGSGSAGTTGAAGDTGTAGTGGSNTCGEVVVDAPEQFCYRSPGFWKTHPEAWPVTGLKLGNVCYTHEQLQTILDHPCLGNSLQALAYQLIAAKLNFAAGTVGASIDPYIALADSLIGDRVVPPVGEDNLSSYVTAAVKNALESFEETSLCGCQQ